ncbi:MAG: MATE family efflux transporter [Clostridiales bacterium]|nr:MATE family efflux transporter [Clostridiales bacterium]
MFSLPFVISNLIQSLYSVADMIIVGQFSGTISMSGVNIGSQITLVVTNMIVGLCAGATVLIAQYLGAGDRHAIKQTVGTLFTSLIVFALVITALLLVFKKPFLVLLQTPTESFSEADDYLLITTIGTIFIFGYNALSAVMRGLGDSKRPLVFVAIACVINVFLDILLVAKFKMGAMGAGIATVISQAISMFLCVFYLSKNNFIFDFKLKSFGFHKERLKMLIKIGIPTSVQNVAVGISFLFLTAMVNSLGVIASAAVGAVAKYNGFAILPCVAISSSVSAMSAQNIGAGEMKRARKTMEIGILISFAISFVIFIFSQIFPEQILKIFADDEQMAIAGTEYLRVFSFDYIFVPLVFSMNGLFIGAGHTKFTLFNSMLSSLLIRIPVSYIFGIVMHKGLMGVGLGAPFASSIALILCIIFFATGKWKKMVILKKDMAEIKSE